jgi:DNA-binding YbaB/EbfC family protein
MIKEFSQMMGMMKNLPKIQASFQEMQEKLPQVQVEGNAGAGMVIVKANGRMELTACVISDEALKLNDKDMLSDLIVAATNQALAKAKEAAAEITSKMAQDIGLPAGMLPGL